MPLALRSVYGEGDSTVRLRRSAEGLRLQKHGDAIFAEDLRDLRRDIFVLVRRQSRAALNHRHRATEAAEHLRELQPDKAAPEHEQVFRHIGEFHDRL